MFALNKVIATNLGKDQGRQDSKLMPHKKKEKDCIFKYILCVYEGVRKKKHKNYDKDKIEIK